MDRGTNISLVNDMAGSINVDAKTGSMPQNLNGDSSKMMQPPTVLCAAHEHPLFVSEDDDVSINLESKSFNTSESDALPVDMAPVNMAAADVPSTAATDLVAADIPAVDTEATDVARVSLECEFPFETANNIAKNSSFNSIQDSDSDGQKLGSSLEDSCSTRNFGSINAMTGFFGSSLSSNSLESSCEECNDSAFVKPSGSLQVSLNRPADKPENPSAPAPSQSVTKSGVSLDGTQGITVSKFLRRPDGQKAKPLATAVDGGKKTKMKPENSGNSLVFTYRKDAEEVEIREVVGDDSRSNSDMEMDASERKMDARDDLSASDDFTSSYATQSMPSGADYPASQQLLQNKSFSMNGEVKKPAGKKKNSWGFVLNPNYKFRHDEFKRIFRNIPRSDRLIVDYSCALQKNILVQGRLYISQNWICFYACIFGVETTLSIQFKDIVQITKEKTALVFPNAIQISTKDEKHFISSLNARDKTYLILSYFWRNAVSEKPMTQEEMWSWIHYSYGEDLGVGCGDQDYIPMSPEEKAKHMMKIELEASMHQDVEGLGTSMYSKDSLVDAEALSESESVSKILANKSFSQISSSSEVSSIDDGEIRCSGHEHFPVHVCDELLNFSVDKLFQHCFTDSQVYRQFTAIKKTSDVELSEWSEATAANAEVVRNLSYTLSLNLAMTSKRAPATERQTMHPSSKQGQFYLVDSECHTPTIPYGDSFYIVNRYCLTRVAESKSRLRITSQIVYQRNVFFKSFIEKNATSGILETFKVFVDLLKRESEGQCGGDQELPLAGASSTKADQPPSKANLIESMKKWEYSTRNLKSLKFLSLLVLIMAVVMMVLLRVWWYRGKSSLDFDGCDMYQAGKEACNLDLIKQLQLQVHQQQMEIDRWKNEMVQKMDEFKETLKDLLKHKPHV